MIASNNNDLYIKCYLKFFKIVADKMHGSYILAVLLDNLFCTFFLFLAIIVY